MDTVRDVPYIEQVHVRTTNVPGTSLISITIHHIMNDTDRDKLTRAVELLVPSIVRIAAEL